MCVVSYVVPLPPGIHVYPFAVKINNDNDNWKQRQPSNQGVAELSVMMKAGRTHYTDEAMSSF